MNVSFGVQSPKFSPFAKEDCDPISPPEPESSEDVLPSNEKPHANPPKPKKPSIQVNAGFSVSSSSFTPKSAIRADFQ